MDFVFEAPDRVVIGTVGQPGERAFYLQVRQGNRLCSVLLEKQQAQLLALKLAELLDEARESGDSRIPSDSRSVPADLKPLDMPLTEEFRVISMGLRWEPASGEVSVEATSEESDESDISEAQTAQKLTVSMSPAYAREFIRRTLAVVSAGRRACPICEQPMHPSGHICPRANGYHRFG